MIDRVRDWRAFLKLLRVQPKGGRKAATRLMAVGRVVLVIRILKAAFELRDLRGLA